MTQRACATQSTQWNYQTLAVSVPNPHVAHVELNRPEKGNAMNLTFWRLVSLNGNVSSVYAMI